MTRAKPKAPMSPVEMRDSGVEWLGEIPANWNIRNFKYIARLEYGDSLKAEDRVDDEVPVFGSNGVVGYHDVSNTLAPAIVVGRKGSFGKVNYSNIPVFAIDTTYFVDERTTSQDIRWVYYFLQILELDKSSKDSAVPGLGREEVYSLRSALPPLHEQHAIASYLDRETARIDSLIAKTEALNALLREKRVALISRAVTKGLDANVALKDSGVEWLGEIPAHWDVKRLRHLVQTSPKKSELRYTTGELEVTFLPMPAIGEQGTLDLSQIQHIADVYDSYTYFCDNDVIIAKITPCFENGKGAMVRGLENGIGFGTTELFVLRPGPDIRSDFLYYLTVSPRFRKIGTVSMQGAAGQQRVTKLFIKDYILGLPLLTEQRAIADHLDRETAKIDALTAKNDDLIALLREKRTALISAAVTGKISVDLTPPPALPKALGRGVRARYER